MTDPIVPPDLGWLASYRLVRMTVALSLIQHNVLRRILKVVAIVGLAMMATQWSSSEIRRF
ncbi:hypothetical protein [Allorhodopirellula solitaria]|uniref:hypothetical protein n=1 Tax=Allorhodopirellula solitaria TaxID=2527987 RepID=UPI001644F3E5|nr:hypothetical protein [Allorhodopirellula solitaria]